MNGLNRAVLDYKSSGDEQLIGIIHGHVKDLVRAYLSKWSLDCVDWDNLYGKLIGEVFVTCLRKYEPNHSKEGALPQRYLFTTYFVPNILWTVKKHFYLKSMKKNQTSAFVPISESAESIQSRVNTLNVIIVDDLVYELKQHVDPSIAIFFELLYSGYKPLDALSRMGIPKKRRPSVAQRYKKIVRSTYLKLVKETI